MEAAESSDLLRSYAVDGCDDAFVELRRRYVDLVYGAALRRLDGDAGLAQDVTQRVFLELAQQARKLRPGSAPGGWLYTRATRLAADVHKSERRRRAREQVAARIAGTEALAGSPPQWTETTPQLEDAISRLTPADRDAVVLRFIEDRPLRSVGAALGVSEDAAQKRISRALDKLRRQLVRRGVACTAGGLALTLSNRSTFAAPGDMLRRIAQMCEPSAAAGLKKNGAVILFQAIAMKPAAVIAVAALAIIGVTVPFILSKNPDKPAPQKDNKTPDRTVTQGPGRREAGQNRDITGPGMIPGRPDPPIALLPGMTPEERSATLKSARARAEKVTLERYEEKMDRLRRKLQLSAAQDAAISAHHLAQRDRWVEYLTGAAVGEADPHYYHLEISYRPDVPPAFAADFSPEQKDLFAEHEATRRANYLEATTNGELGNLALKLDLPEDAKEGLFQRLSSINGTDLFEDYSKVTDLAGIAAQADRDLERRRSVFAEVLDERQMREWESVAASYRTGLLRRFGYREPAAAANLKPGRDGAG